MNAEKGKRLIPGRGNQEVQEQAGLYPKRRKASGTGMESKGERGMN